MGTARRLGGFRQPVGVKEAFGAATTKAGKAKVILSAGGKEAAYGVATDLFMAAQGEGNLANLIEDLNPHSKITGLLLLQLRKKTVRFKLPSKLHLRVLHLAFQLVLSPRYLKALM